MRHDVRVAFRSPVATAAGWQDDRLVLHFQVHRRIAQRKELVARLETWKPWFFSRFHRAEEGLHGLVQAEVDLG